MDFNIVALETQNHGKDWPLIVGAIQCPECGAEIGERCVNVGTGNNEFLISKTLRADWHAKRKYAAAQLWYEQKNAEQKSKEAAAASTEPTDSK
jgi:hypothetical protein